MTWLHANLGTLNHRRRIEYVAYSSSAHSADPGASPQPRGRRNPAKTAGVLAVGTIVELERAHLRPDHESDSVHEETHWQFFSTAPAQPLFFSTWCNRDDKTFE